MPFHSLSSQLPKTASSHTPPNTRTAMPNPIATFDTTLGSIKCELYLEQMPITVSNFIDLANSGFYNGAQQRNWKPQSPR